MLTFLLLALQDGYVEVDYGKLDRTLAREPAYVGRPLYALFLFDAKAETRTWAVLDRSAPDFPGYDVLYLDRNGNGDLTEAGERHIPGAHPEPDWTQIVIEVGEIRAGAETHTDFFLITYREHPGTAWFEMMWRGREKISGGYVPSGTRTTRWGDSPKTAPVLRPTAFGPLSFALWAKMGPSVVLPVGGSETIYVMVGNAGSGPDTLCALPETFLDLEKDELTVTLLAGGKPLIPKLRIRNHC